MSFFIPLHKGSVETQPILLDWIMTCSSYGNLRLLEPEECFVEAHDVIDYSLNGDGINISFLKYVGFAWSSPTAATDVVAEELRRARQKMQSSFHIFMCPKRIE